MKPFNLCDLFCGAGGSSTGAIEAIEHLGFSARATGINHNQRATETFALNHDGPYHRVLCTGVDDVNPRELFEPGELHLLWASPECTHHSVARGGKPINEQSRATAWCVLRWADALAPPVILVENVPEFVTWGGLCENNRPLKQKRGKTFMAWVAALRSLGYRVDWRVLCAADYGDPTTRRRLFVQCVRRGRIIWPEPSHAPLPDNEHAQEELFLQRRKPYRTARTDVIDWTLKGESIYERKRPLSPKTIRRIFEGLKKFGLKPSVVEVSHGNDYAAEKNPDHRRTKTVDAPLGTVPCTGRYGLAQCVVQLRGTAERHLKDAARSCDEPISTLTSGGIHHALAEFVIEIDQQSSKNGSHAVDEPLSTITTKARHAAVSAVIIPQHSDHEARSVDAPAPTVTTTSRGIGLATYLVQLNHAGGDRARSVDEPFPTVAGNRGEFAVIEPSLLPQGGGGELRPVSEPVPTVATAGAVALVEPFLIKFYGTAIGQSVDDPLATVTGADRFGLVRPVVVTTAGEVVGQLDIRFRMLQPHELAAAQGFPKGYKFAGNKTEQVKQIGNAVPRRLARALVKAVLDQ